MLTDLSVRKAKPQEKPYKLTDSKGLFLLVQPNGSKYWRLKYRYMGKEKLFAIGVYDPMSTKHTTLEQARENAVAAKADLARGEDPLIARNRRDLQKEEAIATTFEMIATEWWENRKGEWSEDHAKRILDSLKVDAFPSIGQRPIAQIEPPELLKVIRKVESRGALDVAGRLLQRCTGIFRYAIQTGRVTVNPAVELTGVLKSREVQHQPSLPRAELPTFLKRLDVYEGYLQTKLALRLLLLTFVRPGELRGARWSEFDLEAGEWRIPGERMKMGTEHLVPLSSQAVAVLKKQREISGRFELVFPGERNRQKPISENTLGFALYRMGYKNRATAHGFRATASSILNEQGFNRDAIERQLAHQERNKVRGAYTHHAEYLKDRKKMMQWWADYLDKLHLQPDSSNVITGSFNKTRSKASSA
jgi:integrase